MSALSISSGLCSKACTTAPYVPSAVEVFAGGQVPALDGLELVSGEVVPSSVIARELGAHRGQVVTTEHHRMTRSSVVGRPGQRYRVIARLLSRSTTAELTSGKSTRWTSTAAGSKLEAVASPTRKEAPIPSAQSGASTRLSKLVTL